ncbi:uncharacterized protein LOC124407069 isoform X2 [Diprion similis]|uniref:uncharacterized protein LOC124407069 isoform X2 n=1 Tax=Diprion similis TaxID=362088 RepID=UPI001EF8B121|nr:uncharacterized protein LOC124407069 isoform X2 [Diprion similis]
MLNCTDLECILHHHHYYAHLHQLQPHLPPEYDQDAQSTAADDGGDGIQGRDNDTDGTVDSVYMICGVLIAMVLVGAIIVLLAVTISKLRKREDHSNTVHPDSAVVQTAAAPVPASASPMANGALQSCDAMPPHCTDLGPSADPELTYAGQFVWQFPPPYPPPHTPPPQYSLYSNDQDTLVHALPSERAGFAKGFRKNLGGRWRRLVKRKPEMETCSIPPELKDQLKTIYVY